MSARRLVRSAAAGRRLGLVMLLGAMLHASWLAAPRIAKACSCMPFPETLAAYRDDMNLVIVLGTIAEKGAQGGTFAIEKVFKGPVPAPAMPIQGGDPAMCGINLELGARMLMVATVDRGVLFPSSCSPHAVLPSPEGEALLADAEEVYGSVIPPPGVPTEPTDPPTANPAPQDPGAADAFLLVMAGLAAVVVLLFGGLALWARRGRTAP